MWTLDLELHSDLSAIWETYKVYRYTAWNEADQEVDSGVATLFNDGWNADLLFDDGDSTLPDARYVVRFFEDPESPDPTDEDEVYVQRGRYEY